MTLIQGRYGIYSVKEPFDPVELQKRLLWLKEMEKRYYYIERFAREEVYGASDRSCRFWEAGTSPF